MPLLSRERSARWLLEGIDRARRAYDMHLWAFVVMPEHVHLLVYPGHAQFRMADFVYSLKKSASNCALQFIRKQAPQFLPRLADQRPDGAVIHRFWQRGGGYDENLFSVAKIWQKIDYIHENPIRRGLCARPSDWTWSSARAFDDPAAGPLKLDLVSLPDDCRPLWTRKTCQ